MITGISIENFKGIRDRVEIELRPLTLLFGANSAGKSSILHALHYARDVFERHNLDAGHTIAGGQCVDLGGFRNFSYQGKPGKKADTGESAGNDRGYGGFGDGGGSGIGSGYGDAFVDGTGTGDGLPSPTTEHVVRIGISIALSDSELPEYRELDDYNVYEPRDALFTGIREAHVEVAIVWSNQLNAPHVKDYSISYNGVPFAAITSLPGRRMPVLETVDLNHPILPKRKDMERFLWCDSWVPSERDDGNYSGLRYLLNKVRRNAWVPVWEDDTYRLLESLDQQADALPSWGKHLPLTDWRDDGVSNEPLEPPDREELDSDNREINAVLSRLIVGPGELVRNALRKFRYLGPLRETPPREYSPPRFPDPARWATGLRAWDLLSGDDPTLLSSVSSWLSDEDRLNSGYRLRLKQFKEVDLSDPLVIQLLTGRAFDDADLGAKLDLSSLPTQTRLLIVPADGSIELRPNDVGIGISQVVPVIVTAVDGSEQFVAIEQPELHIHPRLQAEIADLFLEASQKQRHRFLIETHSEHCILRLQRRIRETSQGNPVEGRSLMSEDVVVYHVSNDGDGTRVRRIEIDAKGEFIQPWPDDFFEIDFFERFSHDR